MDLYVDILFAINFSMDFLALFITSIILHKKLYKLRMLIASVLGALYAVLTVALQINSRLDLILCLIVALIMCLICFAEKNIGRIAIATSIYWGVSATLGGIMSLAYTYMNRLLSDFIVEYSYEGTYQGARFFIIVGITALFSIAFGRMLTKRRDITTVEISVLLGDKVYKLTGFCDSGNLLTEPFTGKSVILVSEKSKLGEEIIKISDLYKRYIPYKDVNGAGIIKGITPQKIILNDSEIDAVIATVNNEFNGYEALVPTSLV